ncbi:MAG: GNAT family N-acetyltransferase [Proteobacteria bacterium]|nr:GNAT family N-acetyltransferase [Pseudomonadota bacterium]
MTPTPISSATEAAVLALNNLNAQELSWLEPPALRSIVAQAFYAKAIGNLDAFLLALDHAATYDSPNYAWLKARYPRFIYVDRIAVAVAARGRGLARLLYEDLFRQTIAAGFELVVCEVNCMPPNPGSDAFHAALGFEEVGRADLIGRNKTVRYLARRF